jgi:bifunctional non-homologous end joining protein LigD
MNVIDNVCLYFREGNSDKVYIVKIQLDASGYHVYFEYGRRYSTVTTGFKNSKPLSKEEALVMAEKLIFSKMTKGYKIAQSL